MWVLSTGERLCGGSEPGVIVVLYSPFVITTVQESESVPKACSLIKTHMLDG